MGAIIGNYEVLKQIGEGGFATTYLARHRILDEMACVKQNLRLDAEDEALLLKEAKLLWHIHHHSLPTLRDFFKHTDGSSIMVMSYIDGKDLYKIVKENYPKGIDPEHVCWMTQRLLNALYYLHYRGIIHGDVKPQNIMIQKNHNAVLVDYGLATLRPRRITECPGYTPAFAAPEQVEGLPPIPETDIYGLGASMIFALGGDHHSATFPDSVDPRIREFFLSMVAHDPMKRPNNANKLLDPLRELRLSCFGRTESGKEFTIS